MSDIDALVETVREALKAFNRISSEEGGYTEYECSVVFAALSELARIARERDRYREALRILESSEDHRLKAAEAERDRLIRCYEREADDGAEVGSLYLDAVRERDRLKAENSEYHDQAIRDYQQINRLKAALRAIADRISTPRELAVELRALADAGGTEETSA